MKQELEKYFGTDGVSVTPGEYNGEDGFIITIDDSGRQYFVDKDGNVSEMIPGPTVTHSINPETQVGDGDKITITITATATEGEVTKITLPDGSTVENATTATYEVEENGDYVFTVEQSNGGKTVYTVTITNGKEVEKFSDIYGSTTEYKENGVTVAWIPAGFAVGVSSTIDEVSEGLVITDAIDSNHESIGNEFVWIPATVDEMATATGGEDANNNPNYQGKLYDFPTATTSEEKTSYGQETTSYREPDTVSSSYDGSSTYLSIITGILKGDTNASKYANITAFETTMQENYNEMIKSVEEYGGFYIGRYEMSRSNNDDTGTAQSKKNTVALTADDDSTKESQNVNGWYGLYAYGKTYTNTANSVVSSMVWGSQYDAMMRWMQSNGENVTSTNNVIKNTNSTITGPEGDTDIIRNVYDLYGGRYEWTLEANTTNRRVLRGRSLQHQKFTKLSRRQRSGQ